MTVGHRKVNSHRKHHPFMVSNCGLVTVFFFRWLISPGNFHPAAWWTFELHPRCRPRRNPSSFSAFWDIRSQRFHSVRNVSTDLPTRRWTERNGHLKNGGCFVIRESPYSTMGLLHSSVKGLYTSPQIYYIVFSYLRFLGVKHTQSFMVMWSPKKSYHQPISMNRAD